MREIKFRAWCEGKHENMNFGKGFMDYKVTIVDGKYADVESGWDIHGTYSTIPLMQYTGLEDSKGREIYEGDIVKADDDSNGEYWRFAVVKINPDIQFDCSEVVEEVEGVKNSSTDYFRFSHFMYNAKQLEIIGNIYENPKLLKVKLENNVQKTIKEWAVINKHYIKSEKINREEVLTEEEYVE